MSNALSSGPGRALAVGRGSAFVTKLKRLMHEELLGLHPRLHLANALMAFLPAAVGNTLRPSALRASGFRVGAGTIIRGRPFINGTGNLYERLTIGSACVLDTGCTLDLEEHITIGKRVTIGHEVMLLTSSHDIGPKEQRVGPVVRAPIVIEDGAWLGPRSIILPGITIGSGAVVAPGALVNKDVPPNTRVAGSPAKVVEVLEQPAA